MRIKTTLHRPEGEGLDLLVTADAATTVGDLANYLRLADPTRRPTPFDGAALTISLTSESHRLLDPRTPLADSPIRSGSVIGVLPAGSQFSGSERGVVATVSVLSGPDMGKDFSLGSGTNIVGRVRSCEVRLSDPLASREHARINVSDHIEIIDLGSANGIEVNDSIVSRAVVRPTDRVRIGETVLAIRLTQVASAEGRTDSATVGFIRSPRLAPIFAGQEFETPDLPERQHKQPFPMLMLLAPLLMAGVLWFFTKNPQSLLFAALSPLMMLGNFFEQRRSGRKVDKAALAAFRSDLAGLVADAEALAVLEGEGRRAERPATAECLDAAHRREPLLWTRRPGEPGFLEVRLGLGTLPSRTTIKPPDAKRAPRDLLKEALAAIAHLGTVDAVPVIASPLEHGAVGVAGPRSAAISVARALVAQWACLHSPAELAITLMASSRSSDEWDWVKWLPHVGAPGSPLAGMPLASTPATASAVLTTLEGLLAARSESSGGSVPLPTVLVIVESDAPAEFGRLNEIAEKGAPLGILVLWIAPEVEQLPAACRTYVNVTSLTGGGVGYVHSAGLVTPVVTESLEPAGAHRLGRSLAPLLDLGARVEDSSDLPRSISFLALDGHEGLGDSSDAVIERWQQNHSILTGPCVGDSAPRAGTLRAAIGHSADQVHMLDLRSDGPHALVGGTTGAGKSELLQTWILSMAASHSPQRLTFLLVDYKGGSAFADCENLPHTVGLVTDLNPNGVRRALTSLSAELKYREEFLQERGKAKDLVTLEKKGVTDAPPSLVIVVDEFAALVQEVPEFVDGVVNVAQRGRSLGLHLILATQRPAGVIKDNLRANTNLRMALRVADEADSTDVLGSADAAFFDPNLPGRAVSKTGPGRLSPFQTAYVGGHTGSGPSAPDIRVETLAVGTTTTWEIPEGVLPETAGPLGPTDITRVVSRIGEAREKAALPLPRKPWLPDLAAHYNLTSPQIPSSGGDDVIVFGLVDDPDEQSQHAVAFLPDKEGNLAVFGSGGSGKSTMLRSLAVAVGLTFRTGPCHVYGLDFGARGLSMLEQLPHVGSIINGGDDERLKRLLGWLRTLIDERAGRYAAVNADSITQYRAKAIRPDEARILLLVDGLASFRQAYESNFNSAWWDRFVAIAADGRQVGVHVVVTADRPGAMPTQLGATIQRKLALRMADPNDYGQIGVPHDILATNSVAGRGIWGDKEVQVAVLGSQGDLGEQSREMATMARWMERSGAVPAPPVRVLAEVVHLSDLPVRCPSGLSYAVGADSLGSVGFEPEGTFVITGPPGSGRSTAVAAVVAAAMRERPELETYLLTTNRRSDLPARIAWTKVAGSVDEGRDLAEQVTDRLDSHVDRSRDPAPILVVVEGLAEWAGSMAEMALTALYKSVTTSGAFIVSDGEATTFGSKFGLPAAAKASRAGILLQPDSSEGSAVFGADLPLRLKASDFPPGRGYSARAGRAELVQVALPDPRT